MVLIAQVATTAGMRAPLAHVANQVFIDLVTELERQGLGRKVIADMFGLALRSYQQKVQRISESATDRGVTLWEAVHRHLTERQVATRAQVLDRFARDSEASIGGILNDLVETGLVYRTGRGDGTVYRIAPEEELARVLDEDPRASAASIVWVAIYRNGPVTRAQLEDLVPVSGDTLDAALSDLTGAGRITREQKSGTDVYASDQCFIPIGDAAGWEAALLDHHQAVVAAICGKLRNGTTRALANDEVGGSTFSFDVWRGHPQEERVRGLLAQFRKDVAALWEEVTAFNTENKGAANAARVTFYFGQLVTLQAGETE